MNEFLGLLRGAFILDGKTFNDLKMSPDVFRKGFTFLLIVGLFVGIVLGLVGMIQGIASDPATDIAATRQFIEQQITQAMPTGSTAEFLDSFRMGFNIAERVVRELKAPLPRPVGIVFKNLGTIISYPFGWLGSLMLYGVIVQIAAKLLGGHGTIAQMLGLSTLSVAPHLLEALGFIPCLGPLLGLVALIWGAVVYVKATAIAHELTMERATLAAFTPVILGLLFTLCSFVSLVGLIATSSGR